MSLTQNKTDVTVSRFSDLLAIMAGEKIAQTSRNVKNCDRASDNSDSALNIDLEDDFLDAIEHIPCPEFQFAVSSVTILN